MSKQFLWRINMFKKIFMFLTALAIPVAVIATNSDLLNFDFIAPIVLDESDAPNQSGLIYYDIGSGLKVVNPEGEHELLAPVGGANWAVFSALITDGSSVGTVSNESSDFIDGNCTNPSVGNYTCTFEELFSSTPNCVGTSLDHQSLRITSVNSSSVTINIQNTDSTNLDGDFMIICQGPQ